MQTDDGLKCRVSYSAGHCLTADELFASKKEAAEWKKLVS